MKLEMCVLSFKKVKKNKNYDDKKCCFVMTLNYAGKKSLRLFEIMSDVPTHSNGSPGTNNNIALCYVHATSRINNIIIMYITHGILLYIFYPYTNN